MCVCQLGGRQVQATSVVCSVQRTHLSPVQGGGRGPSSTLDEVVQFGNGNALLGEGAALKKPRRSLSRKAKKRGWHPPVKPTHTHTNTNASHWTPLCRVPPSEASQALSAGKHGTDITQVLLRYCVCCCCCKYKLCYQNMPLRSKVSSPAGLVRHALRLKTKVRNCSYESWIHPFLLVSNCLKELVRVWRGRKDTQCHCRRPPSPHHTHTRT